MDRRVGLGVIADDLINIGLVRSAPVGFALPTAVDHNAGNLNFAPESSQDGFADPGLEEAIDRNGFFVLHTTIQRPI